MTLFYRQSTPFPQRYQLLFLLLLGSLPALAQTVRYVSTTGTNANPATATSWATSTTDLQGAINASSPNDQVWVRTGVYKPTTGTNRTVSFAMKNVVGIYGGFLGTETALSQRPAINLTAPSGTTLSGEIGNPNSTTDNSLHVIANSSGLTATAVLDGFVITGGNADGETSTYPNSAGGGMLNEGNFSGQFCSPTVRNCAFVNNKASIGAAVHISGYFSGNANPIFLNCSFMGNEATFSGGAMFTDGYAGNASPVLTNCLFQNNRASGGGAFRTDNRASGNSSPILTNCTLLNNTATNGTSGLFDIISDGATTGPRLINCVVWNNGGAGSIASAVTSVTATYSLFEPSVTGYVSGPGNLTTATSPFESTTSLQLATCSSAIDAGDPATTTATVGLTDLAGNSRFFANGRIDMGAFELQSNPNVALSLPFGSSASLCSGQTTTLYAASSPYLLRLTGALTTSYAMIPATFGPLLETVPISGPLKFMGQITDVDQGCAAYPPGSFTGKVALIRRGTCTFITKVRNAQNAGAIGVLIFNNAAGDLTLSDTDPTITIPVGGLLRTDGEALAGALTTGDVQGSSRLVTYSWLPATGLASSSGMIVSARPTQTTTYTITATVPEGCSSQAVYSVAVSPLPSVSITATPSLSVSPGQSVTLTASGGASYTWHTGQTGNTLVVPSASTRYYAVTSTSATCQNTARVIINPPACGSVVYVTQSGSGLRNGSNWANALAGTNLQTGIYVAAACATPLAPVAVWVAGGTYTPTSTSVATLADRMMAFSMQPDVALYGGFVGTETALSQRPLINLTTPGSLRPSSTTLSGDIGTPNSLTDNSHHIVYNASGLTATAILDGFVLANGSANGSSTDREADRGAAVYNVGDGVGQFCSPTFRHVLFVNNMGNAGAVTNSGNNGGSSSPTFVQCAFVNNTGITGGAMYNFGIRGTGNPTITQCLFQSNTASGGSGGGAILNDGRSGMSSPLLTNCQFVNNIGANGGAIYNSEELGGVSSPTIINSSFEGNTASGNGGAVYSLGRSGNSNPRLINCSFQSNTALNGGAIQITGRQGAGSNTSLTNCVVFGNNGSNTFGTISASISARYSLFDASVTGYISTAGNLTTTTSPFAGSANSGLAPGSLAINAGDPATTSATVGLTDLAGNPRFINTRIDMGAYELCAPATRLHVRAGATGASTGLSWADAFPDLQSALTYPCSQSLTEIWVAAGTYKPTSTTLRTASFVMLNGVSIYGGFPNSGNPTLNERNPAQNPTILSGDIDGVADVVSGSGNSLTITGNGGNSLHVINNLNVTGARLDGFTVSGGHANLGTGTDLTLRGGGLLNMAEGVGQTSSLTITNCLFTGNQVTLEGGGIYNRGSNNTMHLSSCTLSANVSLTGSGGGLYNLNTGGSGQLTNCLVSGNKAGNFGGGLVTAVSLTVTQCVITDNFSSNIGGMFHANTPLLMTQTAIRNNATVFQGSGVQIQDTPGALLTNCEISGNSSQTTQGGLLHSASFFASSSLTLVNCTVANNTSRGEFRAVWTTTSSTTQTARTFLKNTMVANNVNGNFQQDPPSAVLQSAGNNFDSDGTSNFTNGANGDIVGLNPGFLSNADLRLQPCSPAVNAGDPASTTAAGTPAAVGITDLAGQARLFGGRVDMGAYELQQAPSTSGLPTRLYVRAGATGANTGLSWADAFPDLQPALAYPCSQSLTEIWVAGGLYKPTSPGTPTATARGINFRMLHNVAMYGGFLGTETALNQRPAINLTTPSSTTLSGEIGNPASTTDNSLHVVNNLPGLTSSAVLDGFVIMGGNANGAFPDNAGGGMLNQSIRNTLGCSPLVRNCLFINNTASFGGAVFSDGSFGGSSSPVLTNCSFQLNRATSLGGAMYNYGFRGVSSPILTNCSFQSNTATSDGGAVYNYGIQGISSPVLTNCSFQSNTAARSGGAMFNDVNQGSSPVLTNASFDSNSANFGGAMFSRGSSVLTNVSFSRNRATTDGGATYYDGNATTRSVLTNVSFTQNTAVFGGDIRSFGANASLTLTNGIVFGDAGSNAFASTGGSSLLVQYSLLDSRISSSSYTSGPGNLTTTTSPFASTTSIQLSPTSPAINAGDPATTSATVGLTDLAGNPRFVNTLVDMGAVEFQSILEVFSLRDGLWNDAALWSVGRLPLGSERVRLKHAVTMPGNFTGQSGVLIYDPSSRLIYQTGGRLQLGQ